MAALTVINHDQQADLDYVVDWDDTDDPFLQSGESVQTSTWVVEAGLTEGSGATASTKTSTTATIWITAASAIVGYTYRVTNHIITDASPPREQDHSFLLRITAR